MKLQQDIIKVQKMKQKLSNILMFHVYSVLFMISTLALLMLIESFFIQEQYSYSNFLWSNTVFFSNLVIVTLSYFLVYDDIEYISFDIIQKKTIQKGKKHYDYI